MAINEVVFPTTPNPVSGDWEKIVNVVTKSFQNINSPLQVDGSNIPQGAVFQVGGHVYHADSDTSISGTSSDYVKLTVSGTTLVPSFVSSLTSVTWNKVYNGYYDGSGNLYVFDEAKAVVAGELVSNKTFDRYNLNIGEVASFITSSKDGWLLCDGSVISYTTNYMYLALVKILKSEAGGASSHPYYHADIDKAVLPNLVDRFVRGMPSSGRDSGEFQANTVKNHVHTTPGWSDYGDTGTQTRSSFDGGSSVQSKTSSNPITGGDTESRPDNVSLYYLIKY